MARDPWKKLQKEYAALDTVPPGWKPVWKIIREWKITRNKAKHLLEYMVKDGRLEVKSFKTQNGRGSIQRLRHYKVK